MFQPLGCCWQQQQNYHINYHGSRRYFKEHRTSTKEESLGPGSIFLMHPKIASKLFLKCSKIVKTRNNQRKAGVCADHRACKPLLGEATIPAAALLSLVPQTHLIWGPFPSLHTARCSPELWSGWDERLVEGSGGWSRQSPWAGQSHLQTDTFHMDLAAACCGIKPKSSALNPTCCRKQ